jgi:hypothetical protein
MSRGRRVLGWAAVAASVGYLVSVGLDHLTSVREELDWTVSSALGLAGTVGLYLLTLVLGGLAWTLLLRGVGGTLSLRSGLVVVLRSNVAKYLPGNVGHLAGRVVLARRAGVPTAAVVASLALEALMTVAAGLLFAGASAPRSMAHWLAVADRREGRAAIALGMAIGVLGVIAAWLWYRSSRRLAGSPTTWLPRWIGSSRAVTSLGLYAVNFALLGAALVTLARSVLPMSPSPYWLLAGSFAVAWVAGFVLPGAPGGLGVREAVLVAELDPILGGGQALTLALLLRVATVAGDGLAFLISSAWAGRAGSGRPEELD